MKKITFAGILFIVLLTLAGCATMGPLGHKYLMRGQVLDIHNNIATLCIGSADGAKVGQELAVYKFERYPSLKSSSPNYKKIETGEVKIVEIVDEHYAHARVLNGEVKPHYVVELKP